MQRRNPNTSWKGAASPKTHNTKEKQKVCPIGLQHNKCKLKLKTKQLIQRQEIPDLGQAQNAAQ